jgi:hypothetical protein
MIRTILIALISIICLHPHPLAAQDSSQDSTVKVYKVVPWLSATVGAVGIYTNVIGLPKILNKTPLSLEELDALDPSQVNRFNRAALRQDPSKRRQAHSISDVFMYSSASLPFTLFLDKKIRPEYFNVSLMYIEVLSITSNLYTYSPIGPKFTDRYRPLAYYEELSIDERTKGNQRNSMYSGHVATTAVGTFFIAKVLSDYHPEWKHRKIWLYGLASIPPVMVGIWRVQALKHFPSHTIIGGLIGAGMGILGPAIHKKWQDKVSLSAAYSEQFKGAGMIVKF